MHDIRLLRDEMPRLREGMRRRGKLEELEPVLQRAEALEKERRAAITEHEALLARKNAISAEVATLRRSGQDASTLMAEGRAVGEAIARLDQRKSAAEEGVQALLYELPNLTLPDVPEGGEEHNTVVRSWGTPRAADAVHQAALGCRTSARHSRPRTRRARCRARASSCIAAPGRAWCARS